MESRFLFLTLDAEGAGSHGGKLYLVLNDLGQLLVEREDWTLDGKRSSFVPIERVLQQPHGSTFRQQVEAGLRKRLDFVKHEADSGPVYDLAFEGKSVAAKVSASEIARQVAALLVGRQIASVEQAFFTRRFAGEDTADPGRVLH